LTTKRLKLLKTLHLADTIGGGKWIQENPPPGTRSLSFAFSAAAAFTCAVAPSQDPKILFDGS